MCGKAGAANVDTEQIEITGETFEELKNRTVKLAPNPIDILEEEQELSAKPIDIVQTVTGVSNGTVIGSPEPADKPVTVSSPNNNGDCFGGTTNSGTVNDGLSTTTSSPESIIGSHTIKTFRSTTNTLSLLLEAEKNSVMKDVIGQKQN